MVSDAENFKDDDNKQKEFLQFKVPLYSSWRPPRLRSPMVRMTVIAPMVTTVDLIALLDILWC